MAENSVMITDDLEGGGASISDATGGGASGRLASGRRASISDFEAPKGAVPRRKRVKKNGDGGSSRDASASSAVSYGGGNVKSPTRVAKPLKPTVLAVEVAAIGERMRAIAFLENIPKRVGKEMMELASQYEAIILKQCAETSRLEGRLEERLKMKSTAVNEAGKVVEGQRRTADLPARSGPGPATYALVVRNASSNDATSATEIKKKLLDLGKEVGPVKVKSVRALRDGGVAVITSSHADVKRIKSAPQIAAAGLATADPKLASPRLLVSGVPADFSNEKLLNEVLPSNLAGVSTVEELLELKIAGRLKRGATQVDVILEAPKKLHNYLLNERRLYVGWESYRISEHEGVPQCYGCGSFAHVLAKCTLGRLCHNCGQAGHSVKSCTNSAKCRNCTLRGLVSDHRVTAQMCPCYVAECGRRRNRVIG